MSELNEQEIKILEAAKKVFEQYGYGGARMQQIADKAEISKASLHYYFRSKENLFDKIFEEAMSVFLPITLTWEDESLNWEDKIRKFILELYTHLQSNSLLFVLGEINRNPELLKKRIEYTRGKKNKFIYYFAKLVEDKKIRKLNPVLLHLFVNSLCSFPIINSSGFKLSARLSDKEYDELMKIYPNSVADLLINYIKTKK